MWPDRVSNPGPLTYESGALSTALRGTANMTIYHECPCGIEKSHPPLLLISTRDETCRGLVEIRAPRVRFTFPTWTSSCWIRGGRWCDGAG